MHKQIALWLTGLLLAGLFQQCSSPSQKETKETETNTKVATNDYHLLIGTYTAGKSEGIYVYRFNNDSGTLHHEFTAKGVENPSFLTVSNDDKYVYAANENGEGEVSAFQFDNKTGALTFINKQPSNGQHPCYLTTDSKGKFVIAGNYSSGNLSVLPIGQNGALEAPVQTIQHTGNGFDKKRQEAPHVHSTVLGPDEHYLFVGDLGTDKVNIYPFDPSNEKHPLAEEKASFAKVTDGSGPRHFTFGKNGKFAYLIEEMTGKVAVFAHNNDSLTLIEEVAMTDSTFTGESGAAEVRISPDGKFLYASNRLDANTITVFEINQENGTLKQVDIVSEGIDTPRNFMIDPSGKFLLAANQKTDEVIVFRRDIETGKLTPTGTRIEVGSPVYLKMVEAVK
ncbi:lactonase family protein [Limibacter armeniacum]|uniref:lactonase family protein n=1 Tax=Limibacter armeniacum TaxID=466084 RepID=UPI002FE55A20